MSNELELNRKSLENTNSQLKLIDKLDKLGSPKPKRSVSPLKKVAETLKSGKGLLSFGKRLVEYEQSEESFYSLDSFREPEFMYFSKKYVYIKSGEQSVDVL